MKFTKLLVIIVGILFIAGVAFPGEACELKAAKKKLAGDAKASFIKKCEEEGQIFPVEEGSLEKMVEKGYAHKLQR